MWPWLIAVLASPGMAGMMAMAAPPQLSGSWALELQRDANVTYVVDCIWEQNGDQLTGGCTSGFSPVAAVRGRVDAVGVAFGLAVGPGVGMAVDCVGRADAGGTLVTGDWQMLDGDGRREHGRFSASKRPAAAGSSGSPR